MIQLDSLSKRFENKIILDELSFQFPLGKRICLVGPNGAGKTTLLNILCHREEVDSGQVTMSSGYRIGYLPQVPNPNPEKTILLEAQAGSKELFAMQRKIQGLVERMADHYSEELLHEHDDLESMYRQKGGYSLEAKAKAILYGLGFSPDLFSEPPQTLSGGWRMRLELVKVFIEDPDLLILDEPTNHLDLPSLVWVENYLQNFKGTLLFVSHDRNLLNRLANHTILLKSGRLESFPYSFEKALEKRAERLEMEQAQKQNLANKRKKMEDFVERFGAKATKARQAQSRVKMIHKLKELEDSFEDEDSEESIRFRLPPPEKSGVEILSVKDLSLGYSEALISELSITIERGQKVAIIGANGIGKSTFLKTIMDKLPALAGSIDFGYMVKPLFCSQDPEDTLDFNKSCLENVLDANHDIGDLEARSLLGSFLIKGDDVKKPVHVLSGGEKSRVALAKVLVQRGNFLILDEPTNHLDMGSVEALINNIMGYEGTMLFVSHDRDFIDAVCSHILVMLADGRSMLFEGKLEDYQRMAAINGFPDVLDPQYLTLKKNDEALPENKETSLKKLTHQDAKELKRKTQGLERKLEKLIKEQETLGAEKTKIEASIAEVPHTDFVKLQDMQMQIQSLEQAIEKSEEEWLLTSEELEAMQ